MPRGKKTSPEVIYQIMASWAVTDNISATAKELGIAENTVRDIVKKNKDIPEFVELRDKKKNDFVKMADKVIELAHERLVETLRDREIPIPVNHLTTVIGTMYDKRALAKGEHTENTKIEVDINVVE